jgi:hypothetical protein
MGRGFFKAGTSLNFKNSGFLGCYFLPGFKSLIKIIAHGENDGEIGATHRYVYEESYQAVLEIFLRSRCPMYHRIDSRRERDCHAHRDDLRGTHCSTNFPACDPMRAVIRTVCGRCGRGSS